MSISIEELIVEFTKRELLRDKFSKTQGEVGEMLEFPRYGCLLELYDNGVDICEVLSGKSGYEVDTKRYENKSTSFIADIFQNMIIRKESMLI